MDDPRIKSVEESFGKKYDIIYKTIGKINKLQTHLTDMFCELGCIAAQQKMEVEKPSASTNIERSAILAAANKWANGNPNAFGINGFQAGVEWALKQQPIS